MIKYCIMAFMCGFTGNKVLNKRNNSTYTSIKVGCITGSILIILDTIIKGAN